MKKMAKAVSVILTLVLLAISFVACGQTASQNGTAAVSNGTAATAAATQAETTSAGAATLKVSCIPGPVEAKLKSDAEAFMQKNPNVKVDVVEYPEASYDNQFPQILTADDKPDVAWFWNTNATYNKVVQAGNMLEPLDDLYASEGWDKVLPAATIKDYTSPDGHKYGVNTDIVWCQVIYTNKAIFDKLGIQNPKTYDEFYAASQKIKAAGYIPLSTGIATLGPQTWRSILQTAMPEDKYNKILDTSKKYDDMNYTSPESVDVWKTIKTLGEKALPEGASTMTDDQARALFVQGKAAMYASGSWVASSAVLFKELPKDFNIDFIFYPQMKQDVPSKIQVVDCNGLVVVKGTGKEALAKQFLAYVMSYDRQKAMAADKTMFPSRTDMKPEDLAPFGKLNVDMFNKIKTDGSSTYWGFSTPQDVWDTITKNMQGVITGTMTPEQAAKSMQDKMDTLVAK